MPDLLIDETGKIWDYNALSQNYHCINASGFGHYPSIVDLDKRHGPLFNVVRGSRVVPSYAAKSRVLVDVSNIANLAAEVIDCVVNDDDTVSYQLKFNISGKRVSQGSQ